MISKQILVLEERDIEALIPKQEGKVLIIHNVLGTVWSGQFGNIPKIEITYSYVDVKK
jgi:hypothetical protein